MRIHLSWPRGEAFAELNDSPTSQQLLAAVPLTASANTWGEEIYFETGIDTELASDARQVVEPGTVCFWVEGQALALPYGPTPVSVGDECRLVTEVNVLGQIEGDPRVLATVHAGDAITVRLSS